MENRKMRKGNIKNLIILFLAVILIGILPTKAEELDDTIILSVSPLFTLTKSPSSIESAMVNPANGTHSGLQLVYDILTNGTDDDYYITVSSSIPSQGGNVSGFGNDGSLLFANETSLPTTQAVDNARLRISGNKDVIAYPVNTSITSPMSVAHYQGYRTFGNCYVILLNNATSGTFNFNVSGTPSVNTYSAGMDSSGSYKSTVTVTVTPRT